jgi:hypothetical protein
MKCINYKQFENNGSVNIFQRTKEPWFNNKYTYTISYFVHPRGKSNFYNYRTTSILLTFMTNNVLAFISETPDDLISKLVCL